MTEPNANPADSGSTSLNRVGRRRFLQTAGASALAVSVAGCTGGGDGGDGGGDGGDGGGGDGGGGDGGDGGGGGTTGEPQIEGPVKLGLLAPLPDSIALGRAYANAGRIVTKRLNDNGGLLGAEVELVIKDSELNASTTQQAYRELVLQEEVDATFGLLSTEPLNQILGDIASQQKIHITSGTGNTELNDQIREEYDRFKYVFRSHQNGYIQGFNLANYFAAYADDIGISDIAIMLEDIQGYQPHARAIRQHLPDGMSIQMDEVFSPGTEDYRPLLRQAERANVDMAVAFVSVTGPTLINQWASLQPDYALGGFSIAASDPNFLANNPSGEYMMTAVPGAVANYTPTELTSTFIQEHRDMFDGAAPPYYTAYTTHDALWSWAKAVEEAGTLNEDDVIVALEDGQWEGVQGQMNYYKGEETFADTDLMFTHDLQFGTDFVSPPNYQWQVQDGEGDQIVLWPESARQGEFQWPDWIDR